MAFTRNHINAFVIVGGDSDFIALVKLKQYDQNFFVVLLQFFDEGNKVAVTSDNYEGVDVISCESHLQRIEGQIDIGPILVATRRQISLDHLDRVLRHCAV